MSDFINLTDLSQQLVFIEKLPTLDIPSLKNKKTELIKALIHLDILKKCQNNNLR